MSVAALVQNGGAVFVSDSSSLDIAKATFTSSIAPSGSALFVGVNVERASIHDASFTLHAGATVVAQSQLLWSCQLGSWMPATGKLEGDLAAPDCRFDCAAGYFGGYSGSAYTIHTKETCAGQCPRGRFCEEGTATPRPCPSGSRMPARGAASSDSCIPCAPGQYQPLAGQEDCLACPAGSFSPDVGSAACKACPKGGFCQDAGAASRLVWQPCPEGSFNLANGSNSSAACESCPAGTASATRGAESSDTCVPCRPGTVAAEAGLSECEPCKAGSYQNATGAASCVRCGLGSFCPVGASLELPAACEPGTYANVTDGDGIPDCFDCPAGSSCPGGAARPTQCTAGTIAPAERMEACDKCAGGTYQNDTGATSCRACEAGSYCAKGASAPLPCEAGSFSTATDLTAASQCTDASPGYFATTGSTQQTACAKGSYTDAYGQGECTPCSGGTYQDAEAQTACEPCEAGSYCAVGAAAPLPCDAGSYSSATNLTDASECTDASPGHFATTGSTEQTACREGSFANGTRNGACELCAEGYYQSEPAAAACVRCAAGKFCPQGSSRELDAQCSPGTYAKVTDADGDPECLGCPAGSSCAGGGAAPAVCSPGTAAKPAQGQCTLCDLGTYQPDSGAAGCLECALGTYAASKGLSQCTLCPHPLSSKSGDVICSICKEGFYLRDATALADEIFRYPTKHCKACPLDANCATNTTLETLGVQRDYWRASLLTTEIHACDASDHCSGSGGAAETSRRLAASGSAGPGCDLGHTGPLCEWCVSDEQYFSRAERGCVDCPTRARFGILAGVVVALAGTALLLYRVLARTGACGRFGSGAWRRLEIVESQVYALQTLHRHTRSRKLLHVLPDAQDCPSLHHTSVSGRRSAFSPSSRSWSASTRSLGRSAPSTASASMRTLRAGPRSSTRSAGTSSASSTRSSASAR